MNASFFEKLKQLNVDTKGYKVQGTYTNNDCIFLLKDVTDEVKEISIEEKENLISSGLSYSECLTTEMQIDKEYNELFLTLLSNNAVNIAEYIRTISESIYNEKGKETVIVSLARAGTPFGVLIKDYLKFKYGVSIPHYSVSIIRGKGIDENAIIYILSKHPNCKIQFIDSWTGKGSITFELQKAMKDFNSKYDVKIDDNLAVLADPAKISRICGTRKDIIIPNCCLNSTVSGLVSRTYHNPSIIKDNDFHGAKVYWHLKDTDYTNLFLDTVRKEFLNINCDSIYYENENYGQKTIKLISEEFNVKNENKIKLSIGESSRVLIRRTPRCILIKNMDNPDVKHLIILAESKKVPIIKYDKTDYEAIALIKE